jgi:predicted kinase
VRPDAYLTRIPYPIHFFRAAGTGKTTLAKAVARHLKAAYFRLDTIEHALQEVCSLQVRAKAIA